MNNSFVNLVAIQFREFVREPASLFWSLIFPSACRACWAGLCRKRPRDQPRGRGAERVRGPAANQTEGH
jgi:hypothetical protein